MSWVTSTTKTATTEQASRFSPARRDAAFRRRFAQLAAEREALAQRLPTQSCTGIALRQPRHQRRGILALHPPQQRQHLVDDLAGVGQQFAEPGAALSVLGELEDGGCDRQGLLARGHPGDPLAIADGRREVFVEALAEDGFVVEEVEVGRTAGLEETDDAFGFRREMRFARGQGIERRGEELQGRWIWSAPCPRASRPLNPVCWHRPTGASCTSTRSTCWKTTWSTC